MIGRSATLAAAVRAVDNDGQTSVIYACHFNNPRQAIPTRTA